MTNNEQSWTTIITPVHGFPLTSFKELSGYGFLISSLVTRNLKALYFQTLLGPLWLIAQPFITSIVFIFIFNKIARIPTDGSPTLLFYLSGVVLWSFFSRNVNSLSHIYTSNNHLFSRIYFPRIIIPISEIVTHSVQLSLQMISLLVVYLYFYFSTTALHFSMYAIPAALSAILICILAGGGIGLICSSIAITFKDLNYLVSFAMQMWFYATPILYPTTHIPDVFKPIFLFNPMVTAIELFRYPFSNVLTLVPAQLWINCSMSVFLFVAGVILFSKAEKTCVDKA